MAKNMGSRSGRSCGLNIQLRAMFDMVANQPAPHQLVSLVEQLADGADQPLVAIPASSRRWVA